MDDLRSQQNDNTETVKEAYLLPLQYSWRYVQVN